MGCNEIEIEVGSVAEFWGNVTKGTDCWLWTGHTDRDGYGIFYRRGHVRAHRFAYESEVGVIPAGLEPDHLCGVRKCVRPEHLELVSHRENVLRGRSFAAINSRKTHCPRGHEFTAANTYVYPSGGRQCRTCRAEYAAQYGPQWRLRRKSAASTQEAKTPRGRN